MGRRAVWVLLVGAIALGAWSVVHLAKSGGVPELDRGAQARGSGTAGPGLVSLWDDDLDPELASVKVGGDSEDLDDAGSSTSTREARTASLRGRVVGEDGQPLANARVLVLRRDSGGSLFVQTRSAPTGRDGIFRLERRAVDRAKLLQVTHGAHIATAFEHAVLIRSALPRVELRRGPSLEVSVELADPRVRGGRPMIHVRSIGLPHDESGRTTSEDLLFETVSLPEGERSIRVHVGTQGPVVVHVVCPGLVAERGRVELDRPAGRVHVVMRRSNRLEVRLLDDSGASHRARGPSLRLFRSGGPSPVAYAEGRFIANTVLGGRGLGIGPGTYTLTVEGADHESAWLSDIRFEGFGETRTVDVALERRRAPRGLLLRAKQITAWAHFGMLTVWARGANRRWAVVRPDLDTSTEDELRVVDPPRGPLDVIVSRPGYAVSSGRRPSDEAEAPLSAYARGRAIIAPEGWTTLDLKWRAGRTLLAGDLTSGHRYLREVRVFEADGREWPYSVGRGDGWRPNVTSFLRRSAHIGVLPRSALLVRLRQPVGREFRERAIPAVAGE